MKKVGFLLVFVLLCFSFWYYQNNKTVLEVGITNEETQEDIRNFDNKVSLVNSKNFSHQKPGTDIVHKHKDQKHIPRNVHYSFSKQNRGPSSLINFFSDERVKINETDYLISRSLRSIPSRKFSEDFGSVVYTQSGHTFFETSDQYTGYPTLFDVSQNRVAVLTGRVLLKNMDQAKAERLASKLNTSLDLSMAHLNVFALDLGVDVLDQMQTLGDANAELEIIEGGVHVK